MKHRDDASAVGHTGGVCRRCCGGRKIEDTGPLTKKRMETVDQEIFAAEQKFVANVAKEGKPFFVRFSTTRTHMWTRPAAQAEGRTGIGLYPDGMVEHDDRVAAALKRLGELENFVKPPRNRAAAAGSDGRQARVLGCADAPG